MSGPRGWLSMRLAIRCGRRRWLLRFPPNIRRSWLVMAALFLLPISYLVSAVPTVEALRRIGVDHHPAVELAVQVIYAPLIWLDENVPRVREFFQWEDEFIDRLFGE